MSEIAILDFDSPAIRKIAINIIKGLRGPHYFDTRKCIGNRTTPQNNYYWGCVLIHVTKGLNNQWGEQLTDDEVHEILRKKFLSTPIVNKETGEVVGERTRSTASLNKEEFSHYLEQIFKFAAEYLNIQIPPAM